MVRFGLNRWFCIYLSETISFYQWDMNSSHVFKSVVRMINSNWIKSQIWAIDSSYEFKSNQAKWFFIRIEPKQPLIFVQ